MARVWANLPKLGRECVRGTAPEGGVGAERNQDAPEGWATGFGQEEWS